MCVNARASELNPSSAVGHLASQATATNHNHRDGDLRVPFVKDDSTQCKGKSHWEVFLSGVYFGWGGTDAHDADSGLLGTTRECGILNVVGVALKFGDRNRFSLGAGFQFRNYRLTQGHRFATATTGVTSIDLVNPTHEKPASDLYSYTVQFPLLYGKGFGKKFWVFAGGVMDWNCYAREYYQYSVDKTKYSESTRGLRQRKLTFDIVAGVTWNGIGAYFRYSPQPVFESGYGPKFDKTWMVGLALGF